MPVHSTLEATSPDGRWVFENGVIRSISSGIVHEPYTIEFFAQWTFARFLPSGALALAFESGHPWSELGSYGDRYGGVQILTETEAETWALVSIEFDAREHDESFVPDDVCWHRRGVLAWIRDGLLEIQVLTAPRGLVAEEAHPTRDSEYVAFFCELHGDWRRLTIDDQGRFLSAIDDEGAEVIDLINQRRCRDTQPWTRLDVWQPD